MKKYYLTSEEVAAFFAELYNLRQAEIAEKEALQIMAEGENNKAIVHFLSVLTAAPNLLAGLEQFSAFIPEYILVLLRNTDKKAVEIEILADIAAHLDRLTATDNGIPYKQQLRSYLSYPIAVLVVAFIIANILLIFVMPVFSDFFRGFGAELPALTLLMVNLSDYMQANIWLLLMLVVLPLTLYFKSSYSAGIKSFLVLHLPGIARLTRYIETATVVETCYLLCRYQFSLAQALRLSATATQNTLIIADLIDSANRLEKGETLIDSLTPMTIFSAKTVHLLVVFARTQQLNILKNLASSYHKQIPRQFVLSMRLLQVISLIGCCLIVGIMVIAMYLPIFKMGEFV